MSAEILWRDSGFEPKLDRGSALAHIKSDVRPEIILGLPEVAVPGFAVRGLRAAYWLGTNQNKHQEFGVLMKVVREYLPGDIRWFIGAVRESDVLESGGVSEALLCSQAAEYEVVGDGKPLHAALSALTVFVFPERAGQEFWPDSEFERPEEICRAQLEYDD